jgi:hypothetical protein
VSPPPGPRTETVKVVNSSATTPPRGGRRTGSFPSTPCSRGSRQGTWPPPSARPRYVEYCLNPALTFLFVGPRSPSTIYTVWSNLCTLTSLRKANAHEVKRILSLTAPKAKKVELISTSITLLVAKMAYSLVYAASRTVAVEVDVVSLDQARGFADFSSLVGATMITKQHILIARDVVKAMMDEVPLPCVVNGEAINVLQQRLTVLVLRVRHLVGEEASLKDAPSQTPWRGT